MRMILNKRDSMHKFVQKRVTDVEEKDISRGIAQVNPAPAMRMKDQVIIRGEIGLAIVESLRSNVKIVVNLVIRKKSVGFQEEEQKEKDRGRQRKRKIKKRT
eukprot:Lithocolla_globosa_v1_NODE_3009_length_1795_cov_284.848276.p2 type:complete len:102 gc:universal NODE_3009_length_1795_cov_284.848276:747-442(-)